VDRPVLATPPVVVESPVVANPPVQLETPNFLMLGRETRVPEHLTYHVPAPESNVHDYIDELIKCMRTAHEVLRAH